MEHTIEVDPCSTHRITITAQKKLAGCHVDAPGPREKILAEERKRVEENPGPANKEPWAGKKKPGGLVTSGHN
jgi:hypothetical protein